MIDKVANLYPFEVDGQSDGNRVEIDFMKDNYRCCILWNINGLVVTEAL